RRVGQDSGLREIAYDRRVRVGVGKINDVLRGDSICAEAPRIGWVHDLKHGSANVLSVCSKEVFDIISVDRGPAVEAKVPAERCGACKSAAPKRRVAAYPPQALNEAAQLRRQWQTLQNSLFLLLLEWDGRIPERAQYGASTRALR